MISQIHLQVQYHQRLSGTLITKKTSNICGNHFVYFGLETENVKTVIIGITIETPLIELNTEFMHIYGVTFDVYNLEVTLKPDTESKNHMAYDGLKGTCVVLYDITNLFTQPCNLVHSGINS